MTDEQTTAAEGAAESDLHGAAWHGDLDEVSALVAAGADVNWRDSIGETALFGAAAWGHSEVVIYLLSVGARHDFSERLSGYTALHWAARSNVETTKALVEAGADVSTEDSNGNLAIDEAHRYGKGDIVRYLKSVGSEIASRRSRSQ